MGWGGVEQDIHVMEKVEGGGVSYNVLRSKGLHLSIHEKSELDDDVVHEL